jgi:hypothetical protein
VGEQRGSTERAVVRMLVKTCPGRPEQRYPSWQCGCHARPNWTRPDRAVRSRAPGWPRSAGAGVRSGAIPRRLPEAYTESPSAPYEPGAPPRRQQRLSTRPGPPDLQTVRRLRITQHQVPGRPQRRRAPSQGVRATAGSIDVRDVARTASLAALDQKTIWSPACAFPMSSTTKYLSNRVRRRRLTTHGRQRGTQRAASGCQACREHKGPSWQC